MRSFSLLLLLAFFPALISSARAEDQGQVNKVQILLPKNLTLDQALGEDLERLSQTEEGAEPLQAPPPDDVPWDSILGRRIQFGVSIYGGPSPYSRNAGEEFAPASTSKLFTAALALEKLGPDFQFETKLTWKEPSPGVATNLTLIGSGDPTWGVVDLVKSRFATDELVGKLAERGIKTVQGPIELKAGDPRWDEYKDPQGWDGETCSYSPALAFNISRNCSGNRRMSNTRPAARQLLLASLQAKGIRVAGGTAPAGGSEQSATYLSPNLAQMISPFLKHSINIVGEALIRKIGETSRIGRGRDLLDAGLLELGEFVEQLGSRTAERSGVPSQPRFFSSRVTLYDGSGLSRESRVTGDAMIALLRDISVAPYFGRIWESLPIAGVDGTLKTRMKNTPAEGVLRAKTGTIRGAYNLAGYVPRMKSGRIVELIPFVILTKDAKSATAARLIEDRVGRALVEAVNRAAPAVR